MYSLIHAVLGYLFMTLMMRILRRRPGAQMTPFEFVLVFLVGGVIILATVGDDHSMTNCYGGVVAICLMHRLVNTIKLRWPRFADVVDGKPMVLLQNGKWNATSMEQSRIDDMDVMAAAREKGVRSLDQIKYAVLERNGSISIIKNDN
jgi:uncharacterized membrane protein YcaP (DUF421 family)